MTNASTMKVGWRTRSTSGSRKPPVRFLLLTVTLAVAGALLLSGCQGDAPATDRPVTGTGTIPALATPDSIYLINPFTQQLVVYDRGSHQVIASSQTPNHFYYTFSPPTSLYTAGHSFDNGFTLLEISDRNVSILTTAGEHDGLFPLATFGESVFLNKVTYDSNGAQISNTIVVRDGDGGLRSYFDVDGVITYGAIAGDRLYYSVYDDSTELYQVYSLAVGDFSSKPRLERSGLKIGRIYAHHDQIIFPDDTTVQDGDNVFPCTDLCYFYDDPDLFIRVAVDENGDLALTVYGGTSGILLGQAASLVGFTVNDAEVIAYCAGAEVSISVGTR